MLKLVGVALVALAVALPAAAQQVAATIVTGPAGSTDLRIGQDIAAVAASCGVTLAVRESAGAVENMRAVRDRPATQLGLVQSDVLEYFRTFADDDPDLRRPTRGTRVAFPLFPEEVQVLARRDIAGLADLAGRRVATGDADSGTRVTADLILDLAQVEPAERVALAPEAGLAALLAGEVDALFVVAGAPVPMLETAAIDPQAFHLLPLTGPELTAAYAPGEIAAGTYPFVTEAVPVVTVRSVLVTFDFDPRANSYQAASCRLLGDVGHLLLTRLDTLKADGHPKWRSIDPGDLPEGWEVSACVLQGLDPAYDFTCRRPDGSTEREGADGGDANSMFRQRVCARTGC